MILTYLRDLALREELVSEPAFENKGVAWVIEIGRDGSFRGLCSSLTDPAASENRRRARPRPAMISIPRRCGRSANIAADFLIDRAEYVLGTVPEGSPVARRPEKTEFHRLAFLDLMLRATRGSDSPLLHAAVAFLRSADQREKCIAALHQNEWASNDFFTFSCEREPLACDLQIRQWWSRQNEKATKGTAKLRQCVICGQRRAPVNKHDSLRIPGGLTSGVRLVSFNSGAFEKYGLSGNDNASVCRPCMTAYVEGLRRCLDERYPDPHKPGEIAGKQSVRLSPDTVAVYWADAPWELAGQLSWLLDRPSDLKRSLAALRDGRRAGKLDKTFYCMILSRAQGRATLRSMHTGTVELVENSLRSYFTALELEGIDKTKPLPLKTLLSSLTPREKLDRHEEYVRYRPGCALRLAEEYSALERHSGKRP